MKKDELITIGDLEQLKEELLKNIREIMVEGRSKAARKWMKTAEVKKILCVSPGKLHAMRTNGILPFTRIGGNIYYDQADLDQLFEANKSGGIYESNAGKARSR